MERQERGRRGERIRCAVDVAGLGYTDGVDFCWDLPKKVGVVAVPSRVFYVDPGPAMTYVRFAFCKRPELLAEAADRLSRLAD